MVIKIKTPTNLRFALCLSGQLRTFRDCFPSLKKYILDALRPDVFIDTWLDSDTQQARPKIQNEAILQSELEALYQPKDLRIEIFKPSFSDELGGISAPTELKRAEPRHYRGALPMFYKIFSCNQLRKKYEANNNVSYDYIIRLRPDLMLGGYLPELILSDTECLYFESDLVNTDFQVSDKFAVGKSGVMDYYCSVWEHLESYWKDPLGGESKLHRVGERLVFYHMKRSSFGVRGISLRCCIKRSD